MGESTIEHVEGTTALDTDLTADDNSLDPITNNVSLWNATPVANARAC